MDIKEYFISLLKYKSNGNGLDKTAKIIIKEKDKNKANNSSATSVSKTVVENSSKQKKSAVKKDSDKTIKKPLEKHKISSNKTQEQYYLEHVIEIKNQYNYNDFTDEGKKFVPEINKDELSKINNSDGMLVTVGLDFGTHQTKVCIECKGGVELSYTFLKYKAPDEQMYYTLPSIIGIDSNNKLHYGYLPNKFNGKIIRYFKQTVFRGSSYDGSMNQEDAYYYSIWYIAYILFELEAVFGPNFTIQMGAPTDSGHINIAKQIATRIIVSAYKLVEDIFENDKELFLNTDYSALKQLTNIVVYSQEVKESYGLLVFPEAYACLKPLVSQKKIKEGMSLMIDIGGGTTDISFFTIEKNMPKVYDYFSINKGLNFLSCAYEKNKDYLDSNIRDASEIDDNRKSIFVKDIKNICNHIQEKLVSEFKQQTSLHLNKLYDALKFRPLVYTGGGCTFMTLRERYNGFVDIRQVSGEEWDKKSITQFNEINKFKLFPILSTAYGLSISTENDNIATTPFRDIFDKLRGTKEEYDYHSFNYTDDYSAIK